MRKKRSAVAYIMQELTASRALAVAVDAHPDDKDFCARLTAARNTISYLKHLDINEVQRLYAPTMRDVASKLRQGLFAEANARAGECLAIDAVLYDNGYRTPSMGRGYWKAFADPIRGSVD